MNRCMLMKKNIGGVVLSVIQFLKKNIEMFSFWCYLRGNLLIWDLCNKCQTFERFKEIRCRCNSAYLCKKRTDAPYHPTWYKIQFFDYERKVNFDFEIIRTKNKW